jgi:hypothetical protein
MTQKEARELSLELWTYLAKHPACRCKGYVPRKLYSKIWLLPAQCPLCEIFNDDGCEGCPLKIAGCGCKRKYSPWYEWAGSAIEETDRRKQAAERIAQIISAWEPEEWE